MPKGRDKKSSKGRLDKYYHLAKEQGYRARSAFKLIQLNKKYNFLERSRVLIDLCAAPGGWLQVASKYMPQSSLIIGVDLVAIKPIPNVITLQDDITTDKCRQNLRQEMKTWKADVVLHDGAPNVGAAWVHDAYTQSELVLMSLKLATEFLNKGGTFVTKVFRSKDYNKLLWVFQQLFRKVEATKPPSSRNVSAEIFVVCREYLAPKKIDPRFLDAKAVFSEVDSDEPAKLTDIFKPEKKQRQREGYEEGNYTLYKKVDVMDFIKAHDAIEILGRYNELAFESDEAKALLSKEATTGDVLANCKDLKVLGKRDFKTLLKWRKDIRDEYKMDQEEKVETVEVAAEPIDEDEQEMNDLDDMTREANAKAKRKKRKANEKKAKLIQRLQLNMTIPGDVGIEQEGPDNESLFNIGRIKKDKSLDELYKGDMDMVDILEDDEMDEASGVAIKANGRIAEMDAEMDEDSDIDQDLDDQLEADYQRFKARKAEKNAKFKAQQTRQEEDEWQGFDTKKKSKSGRLDDETDSDSDSESESDSASSEEESDAESDDTSEPEDVEAHHVKTKADRKSKPNSLLNDLGKKAEMGRRTASGLTKAASMFFDQDVFKGVDIAEDSDDDEEEEDDDEDDDEEENNDIMMMDGVGSRKRKAEEEADSEESDFEVVPSEDADAAEDTMWSGDEDENSKAVKKAYDTGLLTAEAITLARQIANKEKSLTDMVSDGFTREAFRDKEGAPSWLLDDENRHNKPNIPVTKEAILALREKLKALNARPIKKIAEAKARKKFKAMKRMQKAQKKATDIADNPDLSEKEKLASINKVLQRSTKSKPKKEIKLVVAKGANRGVKGRPKGVKGRYKMVDPRMKKEMRAMKRVEKKKKSGRK